MRYVNPSDCPRYCKMAGIEVGPRRRTRELDSFSKMLSSFMRDARGFLVQLSADDMAAIESVLRSSREAGRVLGLPVPEKSEQADFDSLVDKALSGKYAEAARRLSENEGERRRIEVEANAIDSAGVPVSKSVQVSVNDMNVVPRRHDDMRGDMASVLENNLAIRSMTADEAAGLSENGGIPAVIAGKTKVSHNPADYRRG